MVTGPDVTPVNTPDNEPTVATAVDELIHPPPVTASVKVVDELVQTVGLPKIAVGARLTLTVVVVLQPLDKV